MDADGNGAWPSISTLAEDCKRSRNTVNRSILTLERLGWLRITHCGIGVEKSTNVYTARYPDKYLGPKPVGTRTEHVQVSDRVHDFSMKSDDGAAESGAPSVTFDEWRAGIGAS
jgi:hypothetical protein